MTLPNGQSAAMPPRASTGALLDRFSYDDDIVRKFMWATLLWGVVGMIVGLLIALQLANPIFNFNTPWLTFGRLRPLHTNAVIFAFAGNAIFAGHLLLQPAPAEGAHVQRLLSRFHFWGWQPSSSPRRSHCPGDHAGKEYAELEWPIDLAIAVVWVVFAINFFGTIAKRRERHIYVAIWFYIATHRHGRLLHIFNNLARSRHGIFKSYSIYAGVQDAFMQWWYGHNAVAFFLTTPFLGLMYYFLPKAADRPVFSYAVHPALLVAGLHLHLGRPAPPALHRAARVGSTLGMLFSVMLWMPSGAA
jgi:cytochrome c oxidase cbb3-type subunit I/II